MSATGSRPVALVTGAARRVGRAIALELARSGCDVIITYRSRRDEALATIAECVALGGDARACAAIELDLTDSRAVAAKGERLARELPRLDVLVHNASSYEQTMLETFSPEAALEAYTVNALGPLVLSARLAPRLRASTLSGGGAIVSLADIHALGEHGLPRARGFVAYAMSKSALVEMTRTLARELAPSVRCNCVALGVAAWPDTGHESDAATQEAYLKRVPMSRAGTPEEAARAVRWLALEATYVTGQVLRMDGGRSMV